MLLFYYNMTTHIDIPPSEYHIRKVENIGQFKCCSFVRRRGSTHFRLHGAFQVRGCKNPNEIRALILVEIGLKRCRCLRRMHLQSCMWSYFHYFLFINWLNIFLCTRRLFNTPQNIQILRQRNIWYKRHRQKASSFFCVNI